MAAESIYAFQGQKAIFNGIGVENVTIYTTRGNGVVDGRCDLLLKNIEDQKAKGFLDAQTPVPALFYFKDSKGVTLKDILYRNSPNKDWYISENSSVSAEGCFTDTH